MRNLLLTSLFFIIFLISPSCSDFRVKNGDWEISLSRSNKNISIQKNGILLTDHLYAMYKWEGKLISTKDYKQSSFHMIPLIDKNGSGIQVNLTYKDRKLPTMVHSFYMYTEKDYILTEITLKTETGELSTNYMSPLVIEHPGSFLPEKDNRALFMPFDNDCWVRYESHPFTFDSLRSYEVTAVYNNESRNGLVVGSVEHDNWKTAIDIKQSNGNNFDSLICYGGVADSLTRDSKPHGTLKGNTIKSPKIFLGFFDDWREGLETFGHANALVHPRKTWNKAMPFGWNSWGALQFNLTYQKALEVSDFFNQNLQNNHFVNADNTVVIWLDSGWNSFTEEQLKSFVEKCKANGQVAGIYWTPFTDWGKRPERTIQDAPDYKYKDIYLYVDRKPQELDGAYAIDPTHPAIEQMMKKTSDLFRRTGFEYVKMDFMTHGSFESDKWYNPDTQTGMQAYNYGMNLLDKYFGDMYINLSISPVFPAHYAQSRRIACDAWNLIKDTEYTLNALSYGWWQDRIYCYNDADHIVLRNATEGENRARITSGVITGIYIVGDDFSKEGDSKDKERAKKFLTNPEINKVARGISFRPVEGNGERSENQFIHTTDEGITYLAVFNYTAENLSHTVSIDRLGLSSTEDYHIKELWSNTTQTVRNVFEITVPPKDVLFYRMSIQ